MAGFTRRGIGGIATKTVVGGEKEATSKAETEAQKRDVIGNLGALRQAQTQAEKLGIIKAMVGKKQMRDAMSEDVVGKNVLTDEEAFSAYKKAGQFKDRDATEDMEFSFIHMKGMADKMAGLVDNETASSIKEEDKTGEQYNRPSGLTESDIKKGYTSYKDKVIRSAKTTDDMKKFDKSLWKQDDAEAKGKNWFYEINPVTGKMRSPLLPKYFASTTAQGAYIPLEGAEDTNTIKALERNARKKQKSYLERELVTATRARATAIKSEIAHIETEEKREREKMAAPKIEEEIPLSVQMKSAKGERKTILKRAFGRRPDIIQTLENEISGLDDNIAQNEKTARGTAEEIHRMLRIEKLKETDRPVIDKRNEIESMANKLKTLQEDRDIRMETWHNMMNAWRKQNPESFIAQDIIKLGEEEKVANAALTKMKTLGQPKNVIERATKDLERIKDVKHSKESEIALHFRSKAANVPAREKNMITNILNNGPQTPGEKLYYEDLREGTIALEAKIMKEILAKPIIKKVVKPATKTIKRVVTKGRTTIGKKGMETTMKIKKSAEKLARKVTPERTQGKKEIKKIIEEEKRSS